MQRFLPVLCCVSLLGAASSLSAQEPPRPPARPPAATPRPNGWGERDLPVGEVLADYGRLIGKRIVHDNTISDGNPVTLPDLESTEPPQRASLVERALFLNNYTLIDADKDTVVVLGPGKNPRAAGVPLYTRPEDWPTGERVFSHLFKLEHRNAIDVAGVLQAYIPQSNDVNFTADVKTGSVIATAPTSIMRTVLRFVAALDAAENTGR